MCVTGEQIDALIGCNESYEMPTKLMEKLTDDSEREQLFLAFLDLEPDLSYDLFTNYFQEGHADRVNLKQDYTPSSLIRLLSGIAGESDSYGDICAGSGGLTIGVWNHNPQAFFYCEEYSAHVLPLLLFNLAIRNMNALVVHGDSLTRETFAAYRLEPSERFSSIRQLDERPNVTVGTVISNPPYSMKWHPMNDERFAAYGLAPASKADYAFLLHGMSLLSDTGRALFILPHGVLFRGQSEEQIRRSLLEHGQIRGIIGVPGKMFLNTQIPICIIEVDRATRKNGDVIFIDASQDYVPATRTQNMLSTEHISRVIDVYRQRKNEDKYSHLASFTEISENGYNLNIPRYVDTFEPEPLPDLAELLNDIAGVNNEIRSTETELAGMVSTLGGYSMDELEGWRAWRDSIGLRRKPSRHCSMSSAPKQAKDTQPALF